MLEEIALELRLNDDVTISFKHIIELNMFLGIPNSTENIIHLKEQDSIFHAFNKEMIGYQYNYRNEVILTYYNVNNYNFITQQLYNPYYSKEASVVYWKQAVKIPITHEFLSEFMHDIFIVLKDKNCLAARMMYFKYIDYFSEELWKNLLDNKIDRRVIRNVFRRFC